MTSDVAGIGQVFFTTDDEPGISEQRSARFDVDAAGGPVTYDLHLGDIDGWDGLIDTLRLDPIDQAGTVRIDTIELIAS